MTPLRIAGISGSLRAGSLNTALLRAAILSAPEGCEIFPVPIGELPLFNQDQEMALPESVVRFKEQIASADAILFATPEYNYSIPGVLKNAIDWGSRPYGQSAWEGKPVGVMSVSSGMLGGARAQYHLRQTFVFLDMHPLNRPEMIVPFGAEKFGPDGRLTDEKTIAKLSEFLLALQAWTMRLAKP
jgi:chromate reductase